MSEITALHTAARRYCMDQIAYWSGVYTKLREPRRGQIPYAYTDEDYQTFPRYNVLGAILSAIERWLPSDVATLDEARKRLITDAWAAESPFTRAPNHPLAEASMLEEREKLERFVRESSAADWAKASPLPFRRVLAEAESAALYQRFCERWGKWYAGAPDRVDVPPTLTLHTEVWQALPLLDELRRLLAGRGVDHLFELHDAGATDSAEIELAAADFDQGSEEIYWLVRDGDWMIYSSHESSITLGGGWLIEAVRAALPTIDELTYQGWDRPPSLRRS